MRYGHTYEDPYIVYQLNTVIKDYSVYEDNSKLMSSKVDEKILSL